jgi:ubiquinone/menaquinone biosynthesis C-methylase UbiE
MPKSLVEQQFGPSAKAYAECEVHRSGASLARLIELAEPQAHWQALDVATGAGHTALAFAPHVAHVIASDITAEMLAETAKLAAARGFTNVSTATAHAHELPFEAGRFDLITCRLAAHHFPDMSRFIEKAHAALRTGGILAIVDNVPPDQQSVPELSAAGVPAAADAYNAFEKLRDPSHARALSVDEWKGLLRTAGFEVLGYDLLEKEMAFRPWVERMRCAPETVDQLIQTLRQPSVLSTFLKPRETEGELHLTLREAILIAQKQPSAGQL